MVLEQGPPVEGILLVRNDGYLRDFCRECLKQQGFQALEARDGFEALLIAASRRTPVGIFVTDVEDENVSGFALASLLESISPQIQSVVLSGSGENKKKALASEIRRIRQVRRATASQATKRVVTSH